MKLRIKNFVSSKIKDTFAIRSHANTLIKACKTGTASE